MANPVKIRNYYYYYYYRMLTTSVTRDYTADSAVWEFFIGHSLLVCIMNASITRVSPYCSMVEKVIGDSEFNYNNFNLCLITIVTITASPSLLLSRIRVLLLRIGLTLTLLNAVGQFHFVIDNIFWCNSALHIHCLLPT